MMTTSCTHNADVIGEYSQVPLCNLLYVGGYAAMAASN